MRCNTIIFPVVLEVDSNDQRFGDQYLHVPAMKPRTLDPVEGKVVLSDRRPVTKREP